jgi:predicted permease
MSVALLGATLGARGCINAAFGAWLLLRQPAWASVFERGSQYAIADGVLGFLAVGLIVSLTPSGLLRLLAAMTCVDAIGRISAGIIVLTLPGLPDLPIAVVPFFAALGAAISGLGAIGLISWLIARARTHRDWSRNAEALFDPLAAAAVISFVIGFVLFTNPPATLEAMRALAALAAGTLALVFLTASLGALIRRRVV